MNSAAKADANRGSGDGQTAASPPVISLPKGGGAIRGMGEKFAANPVTGTGSMTIPVATSPGRSGFGPQLVLSYDSGAGNGPYGFGWSLSLPSITRKTDKGLPKYADADESDVFILSGAEDLVPVFKTNPPTGEFVRDAKGNFLYDEFPRDGYLVRRYRPRIEGLFARIERWTRQSDGDVHWRSISKDNIATFYGKTEESRIHNPDDSSQIFSWLICQSYDDKGNAIVYKYKKENSDRIDLAQVHEKNRTSSSRSAGRYLERILYGNRTPNRDADWQATDPAQLPNGTWMFDVVFDYGEGHYAEAVPDAEGRIFAQARINPPPGSHWPARQDPFSTYRAGFEVRTYRLCQRVLMFHHFPDELGTADYLVRSTEFTYNQSSIASFITQATQSGYVRQPDGSYLKKSLPPLSFEYSEAVIHDEIETIDAESLQNLPVGANGLRYQWLDLDGEGLQCVLSEQGEGWYYKRNLSPISTVKENGKEKVVARFQPLIEVALEPSIAEEGSVRHQFLDLAGDGKLDLVQFEKPISGFFERTEEEQWESFIPFDSTPNVRWDDPNLRFVDLTGDGHPDILITEDDVLTWYPSLGEKGFGPAERVHEPWDEERGPRLIFGDGTESIYLADISGDGLTDLLRIRNGEVSYWPNLGYGRFGAKVTMDNAPWFDAPDEFDQKRIRLADIDGSGTTDIIYLERNRVAIYRNECGNCWSPVEYLTSFPAVDELSSIAAVDLLGNGTACLVWSSPLPGNGQSQMRYIALMEEKPHLLIAVKNNLGVETGVEYAPSTKFYLQDKLAGKPWVTKLPFPVHVVERVDTIDRISRNRFVTRYAYHHGYFDGEEREFRGFGMVEQRDTEEFVALSAGEVLPDATNIDEASHVPPVYTKTWFHSGAYLDAQQITKQFEHEYYREGDTSLGESGLTDAQLEAMLLPDTVLPDGLSADEEREACRALKGSVLRIETYSDDGKEESDRPYSVSERNYTIEQLQARGQNQHAVFFAHPHESIDFHYERKLYEIGGRQLADPCVTHSMTLKVDEFGNVLRSAAIGYGRRHPDLNLTTSDQQRQRRTHITYTESFYTNPIVDDDAYRIPLPFETRAYELLNASPVDLPDQPVPNVTNLFRFATLNEIIDTDRQANPDLPYEQWDIDESILAGPRRRLIENVRAFYRSNDLTGPKQGLLPIGKLDSLALPGESYKLAFTNELLAQIYRRKRSDGSVEDLLPNPAGVLAAQGDDVGGYVLSDDQRAAGLFPASDLDGRWWIPSGRGFYSRSPADSPTQELAQARTHFFLPRRFADSFGNNAFADYDTHDLLLAGTEDAVQNRVRAENDYRVLQPFRMTDPNGNRAEVAFDTLGIVAGTAVMGKVNETLGDSLAGFVPDLSSRQLQDFLADPRGSAVILLGNATTRILYDLERYLRAQQPAFAATLARETHLSDPLPPQGLKVQVSLGYSDGFGREIQKKIQAEPGPLDLQAAGAPIVNPRWVGSGWTIFNNKGKPVRQYEPFFSATHEFEFAMTIGVSPILFYDPVGRVAATLQPDHTWQKVIFDPWKQQSWDASDTLLLDPQLDADVSQFFNRLPSAEYLPTWRSRRIDGAMGSGEQDAAEKASLHANTPALAYFDSLGRTFLTIAHNKFTRLQPDNAEVTIEEKYRTEVVFDIEGNQREVIDAKDRVVMRYDYDMLGTPIHQTSMDAGDHWMLNDVTGKPIRAWDSREHTLRSTYDKLRRPTDLLVRKEAGAELLVQRNVYGETQSDPEARNLRGKVVQVFDGAGVMKSEAFDFKGNLLQSHRRFAVDYKTTLDWSTDVVLERDVFTNGMAYDALNRPVTLVTPDGSVTHPAYNEANFLERLDVSLRGSATATTFVANIDYNAKGQRTLIEYGNAVRTHYEYDAETFRLRSLATKRAGIELQSLGYFCDPVGNVTHIRDGAQQTIFFAGQVVQPNADYRYDAIYRLIEAHGREHRGQGGRPEASWNDEFRVNLLHPQDGQAMRSYHERYEYDALGNFERLSHTAADGNWTRTYACNEPNFIEPTKFNNRLSSTTVGNTIERYSYDAHGNMLDMPHLSDMAWNFKDQLEKVDLGGGGTAYYVYDAAGRRVRKIIERQNGTRQKERAYFGGFEVYDEYGGDGSTVTLERETLHVMDDKQRVALVETRVRGADSSVPQLIRYQLGNHLGSASLELDDDGQIISYEEYYPYGSTSYQAVRSGLEVSPKRYRYTGKERDDETGLYYHGARYYVPWLSRWASVDPKGVNVGLNVYLYCHCRPVTAIDPNGTDDEETSVSGSVQTESPFWNYARGMVTDQVLRGLGVPAVVEPIAKPIVSGMVEKQVEGIKESRELIENPTAAPAQSLAALPPDAQKAMLLLAQHSPSTFLFATAINMGVQSTVSTVKDVGTEGSKMGEAKSVPDFLNALGRTVVPLGQLIASALPILDTFRPGTPKAAPRGSPKGPPTATPNTPPKVSPPPAPKAPPPTAPRTPAASVFYTRKGILIGSVAGDKAMMNVRSVAPFPGYFDVAVHGHPEYVLFGKSKMGPATLAELIRQHPAYQQGMPVRLLSCHTGMLENGFAQMLSNELKANVIAPNDLLWPYPANDPTWGRRVTIGPEPAKDTGKYEPFRPKE